MKIYKGFGLLAFCLLVALHGASAQSGSAQPVQVQAQLLPSQTLPVHVSEARLQNFDTGSNLDVVLTNVHKVPVSKIWIDVYISHDGSMRRGEGIPVDLADAASGKSFPLSLTLDSRAHLVPGDTALVLVSRVEGATGTQELTTTKLIPMLKEFVLGQFGGNFYGMNAPSRRFQQMGMQQLRLASFYKIYGSVGVQPEYPNCDARLQEAKATCQAGVHSFFL